MEERLTARDGDASLVLVKAAFGPAYEIAKSYPQRVRMRRDWGRASPRTVALEPTIDIPLPKRTQTILSRQLPPEERAMVTGMGLPQTRSRKEADAPKPLAYNTVGYGPKEHIRLKQREERGVPKIPLDIGGVI